MEQIPATVYIAIGAIIAAFVSGFWSFVNIIISKDQKTSEFRQNWIDHLRDDYSEYVGILTSFSTSWTCFKLEHLPENAGLLFLKENVDRINQMENAKHRILLRLNSNEHEEILVLLDDIERLTTTQKGLNESERLSKTTEKLTNLMRDVLKGEWERVKRGERSYRYSRNTSILLATTSILVAIYYIHKWNS